MKYLKRLIYTCLILLLVLVALLSFFLNSNTGLHVALYFGKKSIPGKLQYKNLRGSILGPIRANKLCYTDKTQKIVMENIEIQWKIHRLWHGELFIKNIRTKRITIKTTQDTETVHKTHPHEWPTLPVAVRIQNLHIDKLQFNEMDPLSLALRASFDNERWELKEGSVTLGDNRIQLEAYVDAHPPYQSKARIHFLPVDDAPLSALKGSLDFSGKASRYHWEAELQQPTPLRITGQMTDLQSLEGKIEWPAFTYPYAPDHNIKMEPGYFRFAGKYPNFDFHLEATQELPVKSTIQLDGQTDLNQLDIEGKIKVASGELHLKMEAGRKATPYIKGSLTGGQLDLQPYGYPLILHTINAKLDTRNGRHLTGDLHAQYQELPFDGEFSLHNDTIKAQFNQGRNQITAAGKLHFPLSLALNLPEPANLHPGLQGLNTRITGQIDLQALNQGHAQIHIAPGYWKNQIDTSVAPLHFKGGTIHAELNAGGLETQGELTIDPAKTLETRLVLPGFRLDNAADPQQRITGHLNLQIDDLGFIHEIDPLIEQAKGRITAQLAISGLLARPELKGTAQLQEGSLGLSRMGTVLNPIDMRLHSDAQNWQAEGTIGTAPTQLHLSGQGRFTPELQGTMTLKGENFLLINTDEYILYFSPDLKLHIAGNQYQLDGKILIPKGEIKPHTFTHSVNLTGDAVFAEDAREEEIIPSRFKTRIGIAMGDDVKLDVKGLTAKIAGNITVQQETGGMMISTGRLSLIEGKYKAYGQDLDIEQGELIFTGAQTQNPGINVKATRSFNTTGAAFTGTNQLFDFGTANLQNMSFARQTTVGIQITGRIHTPEIKLFSVPGNLPEADILSMLLLGRPANQATGASAQLLLTAIQSMNLDGGTKGVQLLSQLQKSLGLDFSMDEVSTYDRQTNMVSEQHRIGVSKSLSDRLSIKYNMGLTQTDGTGITLTYLLNRFFNIQVTAGTQGSGIDFVYTHEKEYQHDGKSVTHPSKTPPPRPGHTRTAAGCAPRS